MDIHNVYSIGVINVHVIEALAMMPLAIVMLFLIASYVCMTKLGISFTQALLEQRFLRGVTIFVFIWFAAIFIWHLYLLAIHSIGYSRQASGEVIETSGIYRFIETSSKINIFMVGNEMFEGSASRHACYSGYSHLYGLIGLNERNVRLSYTTINGFKCVTSVQLE